MEKKIEQFSDVIGNRQLIAYLQKHLEKGSLPNVIIFYGSPGIGKSSIAKVLAVELASDGDTELKKDYVECIIRKNISTDSVRIFNMSAIQEKEEEIQKVKADLTTAFSSTGKKVLLLDEAHNMSKKAQDSILPEIEHLMEGVYVFICTTEVTALRPALLSRCKAQFHMSNLTEMEARTLTRRLIESKRLVFDAQQEMVIALVCHWAGNQPRKIQNLLNNFEDGSVVSSEELELFISMTGASAVIELMKYIYGSMTLGISYIMDMKLDEAFVTMLIETTKVAIGGESRIISREDILYIKSFMVDRNVDNLLKFTAEVAGKEVLLKRMVVSAFIKSHISYQSAIPAAEVFTSRLSDIQTLRENVADNEVARVSQDGVEHVQSLQELFDCADNAIQ